MQFREPSFEEIVRDVYRKRFNFDSPLPERPDYIIEVEDEGERYGIALPGSVIEFSGRPKARKSTLMAAFVAATLSEEKTCLNIHSKINGKVLWLDTEQSDIEFRYFQRMVIRMAGLKTHPDNYISLNVRQWDDVMRYRLTDHFIDRIEDLGLIVLDGIADLSMDENEQTSTKALVSRVMAWADRKACPILLSIHTNKDGKESTGHLGGYIDKRCSYHIRVEKKDEHKATPTKVYARLARMGERFPEFWFEHQDSIPRLIQNSFIGEDDMPGMQSGLTKLPF